MRSSRIASLFACALAAGCSSDPAETGSPAGGTGGSSSTGTSTTTGGTGSGGFDPGGEVTTFDASIGPLGVDPGFEDTQCITVRLHNAEGAYVRRFRTTLNQGSHHMIVYRSNETVEQTTPEPCQGFSGLLKGEAPIFIAQNAAAELVLPTDGTTPVALEIAPDQMLRIELHFINPGGAPLDVVGQVFLDTVPLGTDVIPSDLAFWGTNDFMGTGAVAGSDIPANGTGDTGMKFQLGLAGSKSFALTTHQHHLGTRMRVWYADNADDTSQPVADSSSWADPPLELFDPPLEFPDTGATFSDKGLAYRCEWSNTTPQAVGFGESANDEMCFLWHYYYPSQGFNLCINGFCK